MKHLLVVLGLICASYLTAQSLNLTEGDEFEYQISSLTQGNSSEDGDKLNLFESYSMSTYKFKVLKVNKDDYKLHCTYTANGRYKREKIEHQTQWQSVGANYPEYHNSKTIKHHLLNTELELTISKEAQIEDLKPINYTYQAKREKWRDDFITSQKNILQTHFIKRPQDLRRGDEFTENDKTYHVDSISNKLLFLSYKRSEEIDNHYKTIDSKKNEIEVSNKGKAKHKAELILDRDKGTMKEFVNTADITFTTNSLPIKTTHSLVTTRGVDISVQNEAFTCTYNDHSKRSETTFNKTNVCIRGIIKNPDLQHRKVYLKWDEILPSAYKKMEIIVPLQEDNTFEIKLFTDKIRKVTIAHKEGAAFYIMPGDDLYLSINTNDFDENIHANGVGANHVNLCFEQFIFEEKHKCLNRRVSNKLYHMRTDATATPQEFKTYALSKLHTKQNFLTQQERLFSPEVFLALYWDNQLKIATQLRSYATHGNYFREKKGLAPYEIDPYSYGNIDSLIHPDNDLMAFSFDYDRDIRELIFFYFLDKIKLNTGRGRSIFVEDYFDSFYPNNYYLAHSLFTGKTQESLKYSTINDAMERASWECYETLLHRYQDDYPHSKRIKILDDAHEKAKGIQALSPAYNFQLKDLNGKTHQLSDYNGKAVYIKFWGLSCGTDGASEMRMNQLYEELCDSNIVFITIFFDGKMADIEKFIDTHHKKGIFLQANEQAEIRLRQHYFFDAIPHYILIDTHGNIVSAKEVAPYFLLNYKEILSEALHPLGSSINFKQRSKLLTYISLGLILLLILTGSILLWTKRISARKLKLSQLNEQLRESELNAIRAQMNPHFIHNCLNAIQNLVQKQEGEKAHLYISKFASLIRNTLILSKKTEIPLSQEIETLSNYIDLESLRFAINYKINIADEIDIYSTFIPPMLLQPIAENAILHGLSSKEGKKELTINISKKENIITITITDNGIGRVASKLKQSKGTGNGSAYTQNRLELISKKHQSYNQMTTKDLYDGKQKAIGTEVTIRIEDEN